MHLRPSTRSAAIAVAVAATMAVSGCAGLHVTAGGGASDPAASSSTGHYSAPRLRVAKPAPWDQPLHIATTKGSLTSVNVTDSASGLELMGTTGAGASGWVSDARPNPGSKYTVRAVVVDGAHTSELKGSVVVATMPASAAMHFGIVPLGGEVVGVNAPIVIRFDHKVTERAAVEGALHVATTTPVVGAWHWVNSGELHFRPQSAWPAHTQVQLRADFDHLQMSDTRYGTRSVNFTFAVGDAHETIVDDKTHTFVFKVNGATKYAWTTSLGKPLYETRSGNYIVLEKDKLREMTSCAAKITCDKKDPQYYDLQVQWDTRLSWSGTFIHAAPWDRHLGFADVSHGCIHLTIDHAQTYYNLAQYGDIVHVLRTSRAIGDLVASGDPGVSDWNTSWAAWVAGSALGASITTDALPA